MRPSSLNSTSGPGTGHCLNGSRRALLPGVASEPVRPGTHRTSAGRAGNGQPPLPAVAANTPAWGPRISPPSS